MTRHIDRLCKDKGFEIEELPERLEWRDSTVRESTVLALINEYIYVTVTKEAELPSADTLARWAELV